MKRAVFAIIAIGVGIAAGFWIAPPFGTFGIQAKKA